MSEKSDYLILSYKNKKEDIKLPSSFEELKINFFKKFNEDSFKKIKFKYFLNKKEYFFEENNFSEAIKSIQKIQLILVIDDNEEKKNNTQCNIFNDNNILKANENNNNNVNQNPVLRKIEFNYNEVDKSNEEENEIEDGIKTIEDLRKKELKRKDLLKGQKEDNLSNLENELKIVKEMLQKEQNEKKQLFEDKKDIESKYKTLDNNYLCLNDKYNLLDQDDKKKENIINILKNQIESYKSELNKSQISLMTQNDEQNKKLKIYKAKLENQFKQLYNEKIKNANKTLNKLKDDLEKKYQEEFNQKISQISNLMLQSQINKNKCNTIHYGIKCAKCLKNPIVGFRYKCSICNNYDLCEECEEKNCQTEEHPHSFIKIRKHESNNIIEKAQIKEINNLNTNIINNEINLNIIDNQKNNKNNIVDNYNNNNKNLINNQPEDEHYSFECLNKQQLHAQIEEDGDDPNIEITIKNNGKNQWPLDEAKLVFDQNKNIIGKDIILKPQKSCEQEKYKIDFDNLKLYPVGNYIAGLIFEINGKKYGETIVIHISIKEKINNKNEIKIEQPKEDKFLNPNKNNNESQKKINNEIKENKIIENKRENYNINNEIYKKPQNINKNDSKKKNNIENLKEDINKYKKEIKAFKDKFTLNNEDYPDEIILERLKKYNFNEEDTFSSFFS